MKRVYFHKESPPEFTHIVKLDPENDCRTINEILVEFSRKYNKKFPGETQMCAEYLQLLTDKKKVIAGEGVACKVLAKVEDAYVENKLKNDSPGITENSSKATKTTPPAPATTSTTAPIPKSAPVSAPSPAPEEPPVLRHLVEKAKQCQKDRNNKQAIALYKDVLTLVPSHAQCIKGIAEIHLTNKKFAKARDILVTATGTHHPHNSMFHRLLGDALFGLKDFQGAKAEYDLSMLHLQPGGGKEDEDGLNLAKARCLHELGRMEESGSLVMTILNRDQNHFHGLMEYAAMVLARGRPADAAQVYLRLLVRDQTNNQIKRGLAHSMQAPGVVEAVLSELSSAAESPAALAFLAISIKEFGAVDQAVMLYRRAAALQPTTASYALNLAHALEVLYGMDEAMDGIREFCVKAAKSKWETALPLKEVAEVLDGLPSYSKAEGGWIKTDPLNHLIPHASHPSSSPSPASSTSSTTPLTPPLKDSTTQGGDAPPPPGLWGARVGLPVHDPQATEPRGPQEFATETLDCLALLCTAVKILYVGGALTRAAQIAALVEPVRQRSKTPLHQTLVRNEVAYFCCARQLMEEYPAKWEPSVLAESPVFLCGDSHSLTGAWRTVNIRGKARMVCPLLTTGLKAWHMRTESEFYPKVQFHHSIEGLPNGSQIIMAFGEIDCREGLLVSVSRDRYDDLREGMLVTIDIYLEAITKLIQTKGFEIFVHPIAPVLNETREVVKEYTSLLKAAVLKKTKLLKGKLHYLDFFGALLTPDKVNLRRDLVLDGTHMSPVYVEELDCSIAAIA